MANYDYLDDMEFLQKLDKANIRVQYAKIVLLTFKDEKIIQEIQGNITTGSLTVNGSSAVRRTISLTMLASMSNANIEDIDNQISVNKKVKIYVGYDNPFRSYQKYGDIIWFPCGLFVLSSASVSRATNGWNISISGRDKMCLLDGTVGGTFPGALTASEKWVMDDDYEDIITISYPTIFQIIYEAVNHWGQEPIENIIITDLDEEIKELERYIGPKPVYFSDNYESLSFTQRADYPHVYKYGDDVGYKMVPFRYPGKLEFKAGDNVVTLLNKIVETLGNYEFFYNVDGKFVFQAIKNYLNTGSPLTELTAEDYVKSYNNAKFLYSLTDLDSTTQINRQPKFDNVKNDFIVWGQMKTAADVDVQIRYHLAIDTKPDIDWAGKYMWEVRDTTADLVVRYDFTETNDPHPVAGYETKLIATPCTEWREELYRRALNAQVDNSVHEQYYDAELLAEWRKLYDPMKESWNEYDHWNPNVFNNPEVLRYWLDFIDTGSALGQYSVGEIGRRTKLVNDTKIKAVYHREAPDVVFMEGYDQNLIAQYKGIGQRYFVLTHEYYGMFSISSTGTSCFDKVRELMYQNLNYNTTIQITCLPKYYMEPNNIIYIKDRDSGIDGNYQITQFTLPLAYNGTMSITATEVLTRV